MEYNSQEDSFLRGGFMRYCLLSRLTTLDQFFALASSCGTEGDDKDKDTTPVYLGGDEDWYAIHLDPGQTLSISIAFIHDMTVTFQ